MTEKRYFVHKHLINEDKVHDKICHRFMNITETVEHMNMYYQKYTDLKKENKQLKHDATVLICSNQEYRKENEQLKKEKQLLIESLSECSKNAVDFFMGDEDYD